ncbi:MAG: hypothetical protein ABIQ16_00060, partial [Polyangiaceae bacterium]
ADGISEEAKAYFKNGVELIQEQPPNYQDAYYQFRIAYDKSKSWKVLGNLGLCSFKLERDGEAIQFYTDYLKGGGNDIDPDERSALQRDLLVLNGNSASVTLSSATADIDITDSRAGSSAPPQSYRLEGGKLALRLRAGTHTLTGTSAGKSLRWEIALSPGRTETHDFNFSEPAVVAAGPVVAPSAAVAMPITQAPEPAPKGSPIRTAGFVTAGVGVAAVVGGVVVGLMAKGKESDAKNMCRGLICPTNAESKFDSASSLATVSNILIIGGGVLAAGGAGMIIFGGPKSAEAPKSALVTLRLVPAFGRDGGALWAAGAF